MITLTQRRERFLLILLAHVTGFFFMMSSVCFGKVRQTHKSDEDQRSDDTNQRKYNIRLQHAPVAIYSLVDKNKLMSVEAMRSVLKPLNLGLTASHFSQYQKRGDAHVYEVTSTNFGFRMDYVFNDHGFSDGFYLSNVLATGFFTSKESREDTFENQTCRRNFSDNGVTLITAVTGGYQWFWNSGANVNMGVGFIKTRPLKHQPKSTSSCAQDDWIGNPEPYSSPWFDFGIGYAF